MFTSVLGNFIYTDQKLVSSYYFVIDRVLHSTDLLIPGKIILFDKYRVDQKKVGSQK